MTILNLTGKSFKRTYRAFISFIRFSFTARAHLVAIPTDILKTFGIAELAAMAGDDIVQISESYRPYVIGTFYMVSVISGVMTAIDLLLKIAPEQEAAENLAKIKQHILEKIRFMLFTNQDKKSDVVTRYVQMEDENDYNIVEPADRLSEYDTSPGQDNYVEFSDLEPTSTPTHPNLPTNTSQYSIFDAIIFYRPIFFWSLHKSNNTAMLVREKLLNFTMNYAIVVSFLYNTSKTILEKIGVSQAWPATTFSLIAGIPVPLFFAILRGRHAATLKKEAQRVAHTYAPDIIKAPEQNFLSTLTDKTLIRYIPKSKKTVWPVLNEYNRFLITLSQGFEAGAVNSALIRLFTIMFLTNSMKDRLISGGITCCSWLFFCTAVPLLSGITNRIPSQQAVEKSLEKPPKKFNNKFQQEAKKTMYSVLLNMLIVYLIKAGLTTLIIFMGLEWNYTALGNTHKVNNWATIGFAFLALLFMGILDPYKTIFSARKILRTLYNLAYNVKVSDANNAIKNIPVFGQINSQKNIEILNEPFSLFGYIPKSVHDTGQRVYDTTSSLYRFFSTKNSPTKQSIQLEQEDVEMVEQLVESCAAPPTEPSDLPTGYTPPLY
ncbi:MAG: hypothetical protein KAS93_07310 [Gammaproteobacteria bacterium]|nr:hypothetical protein [Gammaproteobacteria bacterium]